jgi:hypothetical protein
MALTYSQYVTDLANLLVVPSTDPNYAVVLPNIIDDAEQRIYRDLDLLNTVVRDASATLSTATRTFNLPSSVGTFVVTEEINVITPAGTSNPELGTRNALIPASKEMLDMMWPSVTGSTVPVYFAMVTQGQIILGPWPDAAYQVEVVGTQRPAPLSATNVTTLLSVYLPDLFMAASMVFGSAFQKNFGAGGDDPKSAVSWEGHYSALLASAKTEEMRKKFSSQGWSSKEPAPIATPPRT